MGRRPGSKNKPKHTNGEADKLAEPGHNSQPQLSDEEKRALTLHHKRLYEAADAQVEAAKAERSKVADLAKSELGKGAMKDIREMIASSDIKVVRAAIERTARLARWAGHPLAFQGDLFAAELPPDDRWHEDGRTAGMAGETCAPPATLPAHGHQLWIKGWHAGQAVLQDAFRKTNREFLDRRGDADTSEQPAA